MSSSPTKYASPDRPRCIAKSASTSAESAGSLARLRRGANTVEDEEDNTREGAFHQMQCIPGSDYVMLTIDDEVHLLVCCPQASVLSKAHCRSTNIKYECMHSYNVCEHSK